MVIGNGNGDRNGREERLDCETERRPERNRPGEERLGSRESNREKTGEERRDPRAAFGGYGPVKCRSVLTESEAHGSNDAGLLPVCSRSRCVMCRRVNTIQFFD